MMTNNQNPAMKLGLVDGITPHAEDTAVLAAIKAAQRKLSGSGGSIIAVKNEAGEVYRRFAISGLQQEMYLSERLETLGLIDETEQGARKPKGIWAVYGAGRDMSLAGVLASIKAPNV
jgi:hypothetical protein